MLVGAGLLLMVLMMVTGEDGFYRLTGRRRELAQLQAQVTVLAAENDSLKQVLWRLENDLEYVEKVAREEYGMSRQGERVYRLAPRQGTRQEGLQEGLSEGK